MDMAPPLTFAAVDDMAFAPSAAPRTPLQLHPVHLGPLAEFALLKAQGKLGATADASIAQGAPLWVDARHPGGQHHRGVSGPRRLSEARQLPRSRDGVDQASILTKRSARAAGFDDRTASQLSAAVGELLSNIIEHSEATHTGLIAFQTLDGCFEFVAADQGVGALASLRRNSRFAALTADREALPLVLEHGCSRHDDPGRGAGFDDMFRGLANHNGYLRCRSGDAAVLIDGASPGLVNRKVKKKPQLRGFLASIACLP